MMLWSTTLSQWSLTFEVRKRVDGIEDTRDLPQSQWSLTFEVRKRQIRNNPQLLIDAMSQWSLTFEVRKRET